MPLQYLTQYIVITMLFELGLPPFDTLLHNTKLVVITFSVMKIILVLLQCVKKMLSS